MNHLINSLKVEMQCPNEGMAFDVRHHFAQNMQAEVIEIIGDICNKYSAEDEWLKIDKLEVDVGQFDNTVFNKNFKQVFAQQFEKLLLDKINKIPQAEKKDTLQKSLADAVRCFLLNGILPWWVIKNEFDLNGSIFSFLTKQEEQAKLFFTQQQNNQQLWQRIAFQLNADAKGIIIHYFLALQTAQKMMDEMLLEIIQSIGGNNIVDISAKQEKVNNIILKSAPAFFTDTINQQLVVNVLLNELAQIIPKNSSFFNEAIIELNKKIIPENNFKDEIIKIKLNDENETVDLIKSQQNDDANKIEKYLVQQSGIVLLSPFFKPFFNNLKLLENGKWISKEAQMKGVQLLYFISTGLTDVPEYNVVLEKVLCGLPILFPVPLQSNLSAEEMEECNSLITSAIEHWEVLKSTSVQGFRQTFLQREGILNPLENSWLLQVERQTLDVLLEKIPWGFNTIFLPWLAKLINVEW